MEDWYRPAETLDALLRSRADRGVFRSFVSMRIRGRLDCSVGWLKESPVCIVFDPRRSKLEFRDLLPKVPADSPLYQDLRRFLKGRTDDGVRDHRRIDPARIKIAARNRKGDVSVLLESLDGDLAHLVTKGLKLVNEIFLGFLKGPYYEYMVENFQEPED